VDKMIIPKNKTKIENVKSLDPSIDKIQILSKNKNSKKGIKTTEQTIELKPYLKQKRNELIYKLKQAGYNNQYIGEMFNLDRSTVKRISNPVNDNDYFEKLKKELGEIKTKR